MTTTIRLGVNLAGASLRRADLRYAELMRANLIEADLSEADPSGADLHNLFTYLRSSCGGRITEPLSQLTRETMRQNSEPPDPGLSGSAPSPHRQRHRRRLHARHRPVPTHTPHRRSRHPISQGRQCPIARHPQRRIVSLQRVRPPLCRRSPTAKSLFGLVSESHRADWPAAHEP